MPSLSQQELNDNENCCPKYDGAMGLLLRKVYCYLYNLGNGRTGTQFRFHYNVFISCNLEFISRPIPNNKELIQFDNAVKTLEWTYKCITWLLLFDSDCALQTFKHKIWALFKLMNSQWITDRKCKCPWKIISKVHSKSCINSKSNNSVSNFRRRPQ